MIKSDFNLMLEDISLKLLFIEDMCGKLVEKLFLPSAEEKKTLEIEVAQIQRNIFNF